MRTNSAEFLAKVVSYGNVATLASVKIEQFPHKYLQRNIQVVIGIPTKKDKSRSR